MSVLALVLAEHRALSYSELKRRIGSSLVRELIGPSGIGYQIDSAIRGKSTRWTVTGTAACRSSDERSLLRRARSLARAS